MGISTITLQYSNERGNKKNTSYPFRFEIQSVEELKKVAQFDHVCGEYADGKNTRGNIIKGYRSKKSFRKANCLPVDCDNTNPNPLETDIPAEESQIGKVLMKLAEKDEHIRVKASGGRNVYLLPKEAMSVEDDGPVLSDEVLQASVC